MKENIGTLKQYVQAPRWAAFPSFLRNLCFTMDLDLELEVETGIITNTSRFKVKGPYKKVVKFSEILEASLNEYRDARKS